MSDVELGCNSLVDRIGTNNPELNLHRISIEKLHYGYICYESVWCNIMVVPLKLCILALSKRLKNVTPGKLYVGIFIDKNFSVYILSSKFGKCYKAKRKDINKIRIAKTPYLQQF